MSKLNRYAKDVIRIVGTDTTNRSLKPDKVKSRIGSIRGIAYLDGSGVSGITGTGGEGGTVPTNLPTGSSGSGGNNSTGDGASRSGQAQGGASESAESILGGSHNLEKDKSFLAELTDLKDCNTGDIISLKFNGIASAPPGWLTADDPGEPAELPQTEQQLAGLQWTIPSSPTGDLNGTVYQTSGQGIGALDSDITFYDSEYVRTTTEFQGGFPVRYRLVYTAPSPKPPITYFINRISCVPGSGICPTEDITHEPIPEFWPEDGVQELIWKDGKWRTHPKENPNDKQPKYQPNNATDLDFCYGDLNQKAKLLATKDGGFLLYDVDEHGNQQGAAIEFDSNMVYRGAISSQQVDYYKKQRGYF